MRRTGDQTMRLLATLEYDGTDFLGFQIQKRGRTVQGEVERALARVTGEKIRIVGGGRTDAGVHAAGQAAHFDTAWKRSLQELQRALNAVLPSDIAIPNLRRARENFSARYSATSRVYRYTILNQPHRAPLLDRYALVVTEAVDVNAMDAAARLLIGKQDFGAFGTAPHGDNTTREMYRASVTRENTQVRVELEANAFLYRMVRRIVGTLLAVGKRRMSVADFRATLEKKRRAGASVPPHGLSLIAVKFASEDLQIHENF